MSGIRSSKWWPGDPRGSDELRDRGRPLLTPCALEDYEFQLDPYMGCDHQCSYCYALVRGDGGWRERVAWYEDLGTRLRAELSGLEPQAIYVGWNSDPYQPLEAKLGLTRQALCLMGSRGFSATILTKSDLVVRDVDVLASMRDAYVGTSVAFADEGTRGRFEPRAPETARRVGALQELGASGIRTYALICPVIPFLTHTESLVRMVAPYADGVWVYRLSVRSEQDRNWRNVRGVLHRHFPDLAERICDAVFRDEHPFWAAERVALEKLRAEIGLDLGIEF